MIKYNEDQFNSSKTADKVTCVCSVCSKEFLRKKRDILSSIRKGYKSMYCSMDCQRKNISKPRVQCECGNCGKIFERLERDVNEKNNFCSSSCAATINNTTRKRINKKPLPFCLGCGTTIPFGRKYCNTRCMVEKRYREYIERWKNGLEDGVVGKLGTSNYIRRYLFEKYNNSCARCGWAETNIYSNKIPLEIEHIDGNFKNNKEHNLTLLCPNCHSLTPTFRALNMGNGRKDRK